MNTVIPINNPTPTPNPIIFTGFNPPNIPVSIADKKPIDLVVNWHVIEACNYRCKFCFAHYEEPEGLSDRNRATTKRPEVCFNAGATNTLLYELLRLPELVPGNWRGIRLNIAGGEPLLLWSKGVLPRVFLQARELGFSLSIITNASMLDDTVLKELAPQIKILGISLDSAIPKTNISIGRSGHNNTEQVSPKRVAAIFKLARKLNPSIECKLNTVVNAKNWNEDLRQAVKLIAPDRWKIFRVLPIPSPVYSVDEIAPFEVTKEEFSFFCKRHQQVGCTTRLEDNDVMVISYLKVNPFGCFNWNDPQQPRVRETTSKAVHEVGISEAIRDVKFDSDKFRNRY